MTVRLSPRAQLAMLKVRVSWQIWSVGDRCGVSQHVLWQFPGDNRSDGDCRAMW